MASFQMSRAWVSASVTLVDDDSASGSAFCMELLATSDPVSTRSRSTLIKPSDDFCRFWLSLADGERSRFPRELWVSGLLMLAVCFVPAVESV